MADFFSTQELNKYFRYCLSLTNEEFEAFDLLHDGLEKFLSSNAEKKHYPKAYLYRILRNQFIDNKRKTKRWHLDSIDDENSNIFLIDGELLNEEFESKEQVEKIFAQLKPLEREVLYMWAIEGYTVVEIADVLNIPKGTVMSRLHLIKKKLQGFLKKSVA